MKRCYNSISSATNETDAFLRERERDKMCKNNGSTSVARESMEKIHIQFAMKRDYESEYYCKCLTPLLCIH